MIIDAVLRMQPDGFDALMQLLEEAGCRIKRGAQISIKPPEGERYIRLDTLGQEYDEASLRRTLARDHVHIPKIPRGDYSENHSGDYSGGNPGDHSREKKGSADGLSGKKPSKRLEMLATQH